MPWQNCRSHERNRVITTSRKFLKLRNKTGPRNNTKFNAETKISIPKGDKCDSLALSMSWWAYIIRFEMHNR